MSELLPSRREVLAALKAEIPSSVPLITNLDWPLEGWRPLENANLFHDQVRERLKRLQRLYGEFHVTIGTSWNGDEMRPIHSPNGIGIYVKDVNAQVALFREQIEEL